MIKANFNVDNKDTKQQIIDKLTSWLKESDDTFPWIDANLFKRYKDIPFLWQKFQQRVYDLVQELKDNI
jgi:hypothetical protein